jgi:hypothetical protein
MMSLRLTAHARLNCHPFLKENDRQLTSLLFWREAEVEKH